MMQTIDGAANSVCGVIVTYNPTASHLANLVQLSPQVEAVVVVDNGSSGETKELIRQSMNDVAGTLIENASNLGIAAALNTGVRWAIEQGYQWIVLFDQDSAVTDNFIATMKADLIREAETRDVVQMIPQYRDPETGEKSFTPLYQDGPLITCTSGSFFVASVFGRCGYFREDLFIYCVDDEFSLRLREAGCLMAESRNAVLLHAGGRPTHTRVLGKRLILRNYRPEVQYYWARNRVWLARKYGWRFPRVLYSSIRSLVGIPLKIAIAEENSWSKITMFYRGIADGLLGRMGKRIAI
jgi:rhamnosyltransferase